MKQRKNLFDAFARSADLPTEAVPGLPLVEIAGERRVLIENHRGVTVYGCNMIHVKVSYGHLCICGRGLELAQMTRQQLVVTGTIDSVSLCRGKNR